MSATVRTTVALVVATLALTALSACGGSSGSSVDPGVARVGDVAISKESLSQWMGILAGGDFYELSHITLPKGIVSEPLDYPTCTSELKALAPKLEAAQLRSKCLELHEALRLQALGYLIGAQQGFDVDAELGVTVNGGEIQRALKAVEAEQFPSQAELREYLAERDWTLSVEQFIIKRDLLSEKTAAKLSARFHGEAQAVTYLDGLKAKWVARTSCSPGYVVLHCAKYTPALAKAEAAVPPPANLIHEIVLARPVAPGPPPAKDLNCYNNKSKRVVCERVQ
jgi:hypothetical protein